MVISIFCLSATAGASPRSFWLKLLGLPLRCGPLDVPARLLLVQREALLGDLRLHLVLGVALDQLLLDLLGFLVGLLLDAPPVGDELVGSLFGELQPDVVALARLDPRLGGQRRAFPAAHLDQLVLGGLLELHPQLEQRRFQGDEVVDLRLDLGEVTHFGAPCCAAWAMSSAPPPSSLVVRYSEEAGRARVLHQLRSVPIFSFIVLESGTLS